MRALWLLLLAGCATVTSSPTPLRVGAASVDITPRWPVMMAGYGSRNKPSEGVAARLKARALAIDDGDPKVLVTADIIGFGPVLSRSIKEDAKKRYGLREENLLLVGSHTHSGPVISERALVDHPEQVQARDDYVEELKDKVLQIIVEALNRLEPARLEWARGRADIGMYRRVAKDDGTWVFGDNPKGITDPDLPVLAAYSPDGSLKALFFTFACHCTSVRNGKDGFYRIHPDWAICCANLEARFPGATVMFVTGCGGDIDPAQKGAIADAESNGEKMQEAIGRTLSSGEFRPVQGPIRSSLRRIELPLEKIDPAAVRRMAESKRPADQKFAQGLEERLQKGTTNAGPISYPILTWRFGSGPTIVALAGETCVEYSLRLKREFGADRVWPVGYANEVMCYIPSERVLRENGYESGWSPAFGRGVAAFQMSGSGWDAPFADGLEDRIVTTVHEMLKE